MMKQSILITILTAVILIVCIIGCIFAMENNKMKKRKKDYKEYEETLALVEVVNQKSDFGGLKLLEYSDKTVGKSQPYKTSDILPNFSEEAPDGIDGIYFSYPYNSNDYRLANICISKPPYHLYGITVGQRFNDAKTVIEDKGFTQHEINFDDDVDFILYKQNHVSVNFMVSKDDNRIISSITISVYDKEDDSIYLR